MIQLHFVVDGERDHPAIVELVSKIVGVTVDPSPRLREIWPRLHSPADSKRANKGYGRKLRYAVGQARKRSASGLVAIVDRDSSNGARLKTLVSSRMQIQNEGELLPTAVGEANPHFEAWLRDDAQAVRQGLDLPSDTKILTRRECRSPKDAINAMAEGAAAGMRPSEMLARIAQHVDIKRCKAAKRTGFDAFRKDVETEIGPIASA